MLEFVDIYSKNIVFLYPKIVEQWLKSIHYLLKA